MSVTGAFLTTHGALPAVELRTAAGARAVVTLYGAHLVSWQPAEGDERLFVSRLSSLDGARAIRGGVPVIFPQFAERGPGMRHGFARVALWRLENTEVIAESVTAELQLGPGDLTAEQAAGFPHAFRLTLRVTVGAQGLTLALAIDNAGAAPFAFSAALHSYFAVSDLDAAALEGLQHAHYTDHVHPDTLRRDDAPAVALAGKLDRIYYGIHGRLTLRDGARALELEQLGFTDAVVWNPGADDARALADLDDAEYRRFICAEAARIEAVQLAPGARWTGSQHWTPR